MVGSGGSETARLVLLDKGQEAGLRPDMAVMVSDGIVGKVLRVFPYAAQVLLLTDANSGVACLLESSRIHGVLKGQNRPLCSLGYVPNDEKVQIGERIFTSGEDRIYPEGFACGRSGRGSSGPVFSRNLGATFCQTESPGRGFSHHQEGRRGFPRALGGWAWLSGIISGCSLKASLGTALPGARGRRSFRSQSAPSTGDSVQPRS